MNSIPDILKNLQELPTRYLNDHILLIDSTNLFIRSFTTSQKITTEGTHVGGIYGFLRSLNLLVRTFNPTRVVCVFDGKGGSQDRKNQNPEYKATRGTRRITNWDVFDDQTQELESMHSQINRLIEYLEFLPVTVIRADKVEADDVIAYTTQRAFRNKVTIVSTDQDYLQLIDKDTQVYSPVKKVLFTELNVVDQIGVHPQNYSYTKAILGDPSDNLKGIPGIGIKTLLKEVPTLATEPYSSLKVVYNMVQLKVLLEESSKAASKILYNWGTVEGNYNLMNLHDTVLPADVQAAVDILLNMEQQPLYVHAFIKMLELDKIEGLAKNVENWLDIFRPLAMIKLTPKKQIKY